MINGRMRTTWPWPFASASASILILVTMATIVQCTTSSGSDSSSSSSSFGDDTLTSLVDQDLFLDDSDSGSGHSPHSTGDLETSGSGLGPDDEDVKVVQESGKKKEEKGKKEETIGGQPPGGVPAVPAQPPTSGENDVFENKNQSSANFFSQPGILAAIICGAIVGLLCAILLVMFIVYRMRKKDEGSYVLEDSKRTSSSYGKSKEFFA